MSFREVTLKNIEVSYHRNGIGGEPFYVCLFEQASGALGKMVAIVFDDPCYCAVLNVPMLAEDNIRFTENSWRGDVYESQLREAINKYNERD